ncbi:ABC transporter substrate-binding protein [Prochlorococcus marinus]|uniref:ABC transporter substrate-binding protein n=1 Tax=Prochlorococcus marinus XMU1408 TaxID=2213228 RepID=A0A318R046_PROMR|nr:ABC transporter substrate-binding protein [Prochlorococcus marinus]MBW3042311.1 ABC transporter substrate-binding protein [Prochlorococcus marinus str. XMU1408]PYE01697.1 ABC transporter substrate-binding protein [Prochlorococcus marinus XMU1408]
MLKVGNVKNIFKILSIFLILLQLSCVQNKRRENIIVASAGKVESLDPAQANTLRTLQILSALGDTLYKINKQGNLSPNLAKDLPKVSKNGLLIDIPLKKNISFHDGSIFNAEAMKFSLNRFMKIGTLNYLLNDKIEDIEIKDEFLLRIKLKKPSSSIKSLLTSVNLTPVSPSSYSNFKDKFNNKGFIGTGPYFLKSFSATQQTIKPFKNYWGEKPLNQGIDFINYSNSSTLFGAIKTKEVDVLISNSIDDMQRVTLNRMVQNDKLRSGEGKAIEIGFITFKSNKSPLGNQRVREALSYTLDRQLISKQVSFGTREPLRSIVPPQLYKKEFSPWPIYKPNLARTLLKKEGYCEKDILSIPLTFRSNVPADKLLALTWKDQIKRDLSDCIKISLNGVESTTVYKQLSEGAFEAVILDWTGSYPDPEAYLTPLLSCTKINNNTCLKGEAVFSGSFWGNNKVQELLNKSEELEGENRLNTLVKVEELAAQGSSYLPVWLVKPKAWSLTDITQPEFSNNGLIILKNLKRN